MIWSGRLTIIEGGHAIGTLTDEWDWTLGVEGRAQGANRLALICHLALRGHQPPQEHEDSRRQHAALEAGGHLTGEIIRQQLWLGASFRWNGQVIGPWQMRLRSLPCTRLGPVSLRGETL